jgi:Flp pilus assembly protein TadG
MKTLLRRFVAEEFGAASVLMICTLPMFLSLAGLAIDGAAAFRTQTILQSTADIAALAAVVDLPSTSTAASDAVSYAQKNLPVSGNGTVLATSDVATGNWNSTTRVFTANGTPLNAVSVTVRRAAANGNALPTSFLMLIGKSSWDVAANAIASTAGSGTDCMLSLDPSSGSAISLTGAIDLNMPNCGIADNSASASALQLSGAIDVTAASANIVGNYTKSGAITINIPSGSLKTGTAATADPYASVPIPSYSGCTFPGGKSFTGAGNITLSPGVYCGNISIVGAYNVTMQAGTYILDQGSFTISGAATVTGSGVAIVLTSSTGTNIGNFNVSGATTMNLSAETSGSLAGLVIYQDRRASGSGDADAFVGASSSKFAGALYFPSEKLTYNGASSGGPGCTQLIADQLVITGSGNLDDTTCASLGASAIGSSGIKLVE